MASRYSHRLAEVLQCWADQTPEARLGRYCLVNDVPVATVAASLGVSRQTVYNWFWSRFTPTAEQRRAIEGLLERLQAEAVPA